MMFPSGKIYQIFIVQSKRRDAITDSFSCFRSGGFYGFPYLFEYRLYVFREGVNILIHGIDLAFHKNSLHVVVYPALLHKGAIQSRFDEILLVPDTQIRATARPSSGFAWERLQIQNTILFEYHQLYSLG